LLENLTDMQLANDILKTAKNAQEAEKLNIIDRQYQGLGMREMTPLDKTSNEFNEIDDYLGKSAGATHHVSYKVQNIFRIERNGEGDRFAMSPYAKIKSSERRLLWHGSRCTNFGGILSQGLRIAPPEAPVSGYMFGKGVYLADMSTKSANYCNASQSGNIALLLLCEAELGKPPLKLKNSDYNAGEEAKKAGCISTLGVGQTAPQKWKDAGCIHENLKGVLMPDVSVQPGASSEDAYLLYNEYIVYDIAQVRLRYLLRVKM
jgi:poly [ADP-ribose] polymerase